MKKQIEELELQEISAAATLCVCTCTYLGLIQLARSSTHRMVRLTRGSDETVVIASAMDSIVVHEDGPTLAVFMALKQAVKKPAAACKTARCRNAAMRKWLETIEPASSPVYPALQHRRLME